MSDSAEKVSKTRGGPRWRILPDRFETSRLLRATSFVAVLLSGSGCTSGPGQRFDSLVAQYGLASDSVPGTQFLHRYVHKRAEREAKDLHIYLDGDGSPWIRRRQVAKDPTARDPVALRLMLHDPAHSIYLGRPCYHNVDGTPPCHPRYWTSARYGTAVVESMASALRRLVRQTDHAGSITLFGFSGGGTLGLLLAQRVDQVDRVVTVAANLDTAAWTGLHGYSPLSGSLNPAARAPLRREVWQLHLAGRDDEIVPPSLIERALHNQSDASLAVVAGFSHRCCWERAWPAVIDALQGPLPACAALERSLKLTSCRRVTPAPGHARNDGALESGGLQ